MRASTIGRSVFAALAVLGITAGVMVGQMTKPDKAKACPVCAVIAGVGVYEVVTTGIVAGAAVGVGTQLGRISNHAESRAKEIHKPGGVKWDKWMVKVRHRRAVGANIWKGSLSKMANWFKNHVGTFKIKKRWPEGAFWCFTNAAGSYLSNHNLRDAALACIGGFLAGVSERPKGKAPGQPPAYYDAAMQAAVGAPWSAVTVDPAVEGAVPPEVMALETP
jgi:hypothetical protein